jgi:hypothetical protein
MALAALLQLGRRLLAFLGRRRVLDRREAVARVFQLLDLLEVVAQIVAANVELGCRVVLKVLVIQDCQAPDILRPVSLGTASVFIAPGGRVVPQHALAVALVVRDHTAEPDLFIRAVGSNPVTTREIGHSALAPQAFSSTETLLVYGRSPSA